jgi:alpha-glucosidase
MTLKYDPLALEKSTIAFSKTRFQILTDRLIRMEWAEDGVFEDRATLAVVNRRMTPVKFTKKYAGKIIVLDTGKVCVEYTDDGKNFSKKNLRAAFKLNGKTAEWFPGKEDKENLKGTHRTLDETFGGRVPLGNGLVSRSGWALVDDSENIVLNVERGRRWVRQRHKAERSDLYLLAYGRDYKDAVRDASEIFGRQPLTPIKSLGYWWSRYWTYTDRDFEEIVENFNRMQVPIDVMVVDMDWHKDGWTGYTWEKRYFPDPLEFLNYLKNEDLMITLNLHPADGVGRHEEQFEDVARACKLDTKKTKRVEFDAINPTYMDAYFKYLHHPQEKNGVDFWWIDWQQGEKTRMEGLDALPWLNQLHWEDMEKNRSDKRTLILSRFGGLGAGRYPIGFSGDTIAFWETLAFQPHFTATAANVLFGYWSHDVGGHMWRDTSPELYARWIQYGSLSPVLRTHTTKSPINERRFWKFPEPFCDAMRAAILKRYEMIPYIYTENRKCFDSGVSLCRPLYYEWPENEEAYTMKEEYLFGSEMIAAPVVSPAEGYDDMTALTVWLPKGNWHDNAVGMPVKGGGKITRRYNIHEIPIYVREGAVIPGMRIPHRITPGSYKDFVVNVYPGERGEYNLYEDDGATQGYLKGEFAWMKISHETRKGVKEIRVAPADGNYKGFVRNRSLEIRLHCSASPLEVRANGRKVDFAFRLGAEGWAYDGYNAATVIRVAEFDARKGITVRVKRNPRVSDKLAFGLKGLFSRLAMVRNEATNAAGTLITHVEEYQIVGVAQTPNRISRFPETFKNEISNLGAEIRKLPAAMKGIKSKTRYKELAQKFSQKGLNILDTIQKEFALRK